MKNVNTFHPDTCGSLLRCAIDFEWDSSDLPETRVHKVIAHRPCPLHAEAHGMKHDLHPVWQENVKKNVALNLLADKAGIDPNLVRFSHDLARKLTLTAPVTAGQLAAVVAHLAANGHADVRVVNG